MTEQEYVDTMQLAHVMQAKKSLDYIVPEISSVVTNEEINIVNTYLSKWETLFFNKIKTTK